MEEQTEIKKNVNVTCYRKYDYENDNTEDVKKISVPPVYFHSDVPVQKVFPLKMQVLD